MCVGDSTLQNLRSKDMKINFLEDRGIPRKHKHELADIRKQDNTLDEQKYFFLNPHKGHLQKNPELTLGTC